MIEMNGERESRTSVLAAWYADDHDEVSTNPWQKQPVRVDLHFFLYFWPVTPTTDHVWDRPCQLIPFSDEETDTQATVHAKN